MQIYCNKCGLVHTLTDGEAERVIYTLQGMEFHARWTDKEEPNDPDHDYNCLQDILRYGYDTEAFGEFADMSIDNRRFLKHGCGHDQ